MTEVSSLTFIKNVCGTWCRVRNGSRADYRLRAETDLRPTFLARCISRQIGNRSVKSLTDFGLAKPFVPQFRH